MNEKPQSAMVSICKKNNRDISLGAFLLSLMIDANEHWGVVFADVTGAYLHAIKDELVVERVTGTEVDIMCEIIPLLKCPLLGRRSIHSTQQSIVFVI